MNRRPTLEDQAAGAVLKLLRAELANREGKKTLSQDIICERLTDVSFIWERSVLSRLETGDISINDSYLIPLCKVYSISRDDFYIRVASEIQRLKIDVIDPLPPFHRTPPPIAPPSVAPTAKKISNIENQPLTDLVSGRDDEIGWLTSIFFPGGEFARRQKCAVTGMGGIGKTTLALEYARLNANRYQYRLFCLASSANSLRASFLDMAEMLKNVDADIQHALQTGQNTEEDIKKVIVAVHNWLTKTEDYLLIVDNADVIPSDIRDVEIAPDNALDIDVLRDSRDQITEKEIAAYYPQPAHMSGHVLITTRNSIPPDVFGNVRVRDLSTLLPEHAEIFLLRRTLKEDVVLPGEEQDALRLLVEHLGGLPLALEQAGAYIRNKMRGKVKGFSSYISLYLSPEQLRAAEKAIDILELHEPSLGKYGSTVAKTWLISFAAVKAESAASAEAFTLSSFLDPEAIPCEILGLASQLVINGERAALPALNAHFEPATTPEESDDCMDRLFEPLVRYSLVYKNPDMSQTFNMHRLVQAVRRKTLSPDQWQFYYDVFVESAWLQIDNE